MFQSEGATMNNRSEFSSSCRHKDKHFLCNPQRKKKNKQTASLSLALWSQILSLSHSYLDPWPVSRTLIFFSTT